LHASYNLRVTGPDTFADAGPSAADAELSSVIADHIARAGGWLPFDRYMALALYAPGLGYYSRSSRQFGHLPASGSDFVTAPELSPLFGAALARAVAQALRAAGADTVFEFGAGSGALAEQVLEALGDSVRRYVIVDLSGALRERQAARLARFGARVHWLDAWPDTMHGVVLGNEVLDAMPVQVLHFDGQQWWERGVVSADVGLAYADRPTAQRPPHAGPYVPGTVTETHLQAEAFLRSLADRLQHGAAFFIDYGFPEAEYYHPQRAMGTLVAHRAHLTEMDAGAVLREPGSKDITAHVNFSAMALAAQDAGLQVLGYTSQANFLLNCGILDLLPAGDLRATAHVQKLLTEHEMGELFKVLALARGPGFGTDFDALGFARGDRSHTL
jgi:SAM-dependent MidA family methyltransferase